MALVLVLDLHHAKQVDMKKMKESTVYNYKVQFEPQISFLDNLNKLAGDDKNFDIKDLIQNLNTVEEKKQQDTKSSTDDDDIDFAMRRWRTQPQTHSRGHLRLRQRRHRDGEDHDCVSDWSPAQEMS